ncbi:MAG: septation regulator SpoVG [Spirochaetia bacterium]|nr:septation regulator SpoVG [Spirochaetia bacterium]
MKITEVRIRTVSGESKLKAYATVTFDDEFVVHNIKVIESKTGPFIAMPARLTANNEYKDIVHPINSDFRNKLQQTILDAYEKEASKAE